MAIEQVSEPLEIQPRLPRGKLKWAEFPWTAVIVIALGILIAYAILADKEYQAAFRFLIAGLRFTIIVSLVAYALALVLGLIAGLGRVSKNVFFYTISTFYVVVVRGIPMLILIIYFAYVMTPLGLDLLARLGGLLLHTPLASWGTALIDLTIRDVDMTARAIIGLAFGYGAFLAEIFRAGFESIDRGQMEAARSLGMNYVQAMRYVILPQAVRRIMPPLGNDFIAMVKDSSLLSVLAVRELTQLGKLHRAATFSTFETWNTVAFLYLSMTLLLSLGVGLMERRLRVEK